VLDGLGRCKQSRIESGRTLVCIEDFLAFLDDAVNCRAGLALGTFAKNFEDLLKALDMDLGFVAVLFERRLEVRGLGAPGHFWQSFQNFALSVVHILQSVVEEVVQRFFFWHGKLLRRC